MQIRKSYGGMKCDSEMIQAIINQKIKDFGVTGNVFLSLREKKILLYRMIFLYPYPIFNRLFITLLWKLKNFMNLVKS